MYLEKRALVDTVNIKASVIDRKLDRSKKQRYTKSLLSNYKALCHRTGSLVMKYFY